ncbi:hypothetical protein [Coleofasciculus sp. FACHB-1120]|uniref:hypothetical protein n=1 Tax=Coleofasciculus sp. FACHB-1120 TaxID=2692783 RepID=UPI0019BE8340|nr:hypothetical protein [Coleofasciculus sp. FACHB-1120]MBD2742684.1 hypothetical protein [Coleofasciculus sp. FACHB-1120]
MIRDLPLNIDVAEISTTNAVRVLGTRSRVAALHSAFFFWTPWHALQVFNS